MRVQRCATALLAVLVALLVLESDGRLTGRPTDHVEENKAGRGEASASAAREKTGSTPQLASLERTFQLIDIFMGTTINQEAKTTPSVSPPFGNLLVGPETEAGENKCVPPYYYDRTELTGIRLSHWLSGSCTNDFGSFSVRPGFAGSFVSSYTHDQEDGTPALYSVRDLFGGQVNMTTAATSHTAVIQFDLSTDTAPLEIEVGGNRGDSACTWDADAEELSCLNKVYRLYAGNGRPAGFSAYLKLQVRPAPDEVVDGSNGNAVLRFTSQAHRVIVRAAVSMVDYDGASTNMKMELGDSFNATEVSGQTKQAWLEEIGKIRVGDDASDEELSKFYTAMYHASLLPREFSDADGRFPSFGGGSKVHTWPKGHVYYNDFSAWDTFRAFHPLHSIISRRRSVEFARSLVQMGLDGGWLPIFPAWNSYTGEMIGDHVIAILGDFITKGLLDSEPELIKQAYKLMKQNAESTPNFIEYYVEGKGRRSLSAYKRLGYVPLEEENLLSYHPYEQSSRTIEYSFDDAVLATVACGPRINDTKTCESMTKRAQNYRNVIDKSFGFVNGRHVTGQFEAKAHVNPESPQHFVTEGTPWQWTFAPLHDPVGLMHALGLDEAKFEEKLDQLFALGQYNHDNEPSHHIAFLYNFVGAYHKTQSRVHEIRRSQYGVGPKGLSGNDDAGQISAWYILAAMGLYQTSSHRPVFQVFQPVFSHIELHLENNSVFTISTPSLRETNPANTAYLHAAVINGVCMHHAEISYDQIMSGGLLALNVTDKPPTKAFVSHCALDKVAQAEI